MRYILSFYDMIDGWIGELDSSDDLEAMMKERDRRQAGLGEGNKAAGEHYGVIDQQTGREVDCLVKDRVSELLYFPTFTSGYNILFILRG
jgi:hypothetical protein